MIASARVQSPGALASIVANALSGELQVEKKSETPLSSLRLASAFTAIMSSLDIS